MYYKENLEFVENYCDNVLDKLRPMYENLKKEQITYERPCIVRERLLSKSDEVLKEYEYIITTTRTEPKYTDDEIIEIIKEHMNKEELNKFINVLNNKNKGYIKMSFIMDYYRWNYNKQYCIKILKERYDEYFRNQRRRLKNIEKKNKLKNI